MAKVLLSFYNNMNDVAKIPVFYDGLIRALVRNGNSTLVISSNVFMETVPGDRNGLFPNCSATKLSAIVDRFSPELVIAFNGSIPAELLENLHCPVLIWEADSVVYFNNKEILKRRSGEYYFGAVSSSSERQLRETFAIPESRIMPLPFATDLRAFEMPQTIGVSFIGSNFGGSGVIVNFVKQHDYEANQALSGLIDELKKNPMIEPESFAQRLEDIDPCLVKYYKMGYFHHLISNEYRIDVLNEIRDCGLRLYGNADWNCLAHSSYSLALCFDKDEKYSLTHNEAIYNSSKVCINISHVQAITALPWRIRDVMATNGCLVSEAKEDFSSFGKELKIPTFTNKYEARAICKELLSDERRRREIVELSQAEIERNHRFENRFAVIENVCGVSLKGEAAGEARYLTRSAIQTFNYKYETKKMLRSAKRKVRRILFH
jgi:Glycosyl transferases group 1